MAIIALQVTQHWILGSVMLRSHPLFLVHNPGDVTQQLWRSCRHSEWRLWWSGFRQWPWSWRKTELGVLEEEEPQVLEWIGCKGEGGGQARKIPSFQTWLIWVDKGRSTSIYCFYPFSQRNRPSCSKGIRAASLALPFIVQIHLRAVDQH